MSDNKDYLGHRARMRERFLHTDPSKLADYELLELFLYQIYKRADVKPVAKELLRTFRSISGIIGAEKERLSAVKGVGEQSVVMFKVLHELVCRILREDLRKRPLLNSLEKVGEYCKVSMSFLSCEQSRVLFLNSKNHLILDEIHQFGTIDHTAVYPREIVRRALDLGASGIILVHNHPSGDPQPSPEDISFTRHMAELGKMMQIKIYDHIVVGRYGYFSMKKEGLI